MFDLPSRGDMIRGLRLGRTPAGTGTGAEEHAEGIGVPDDTAGTMPLREEMQLHRELLLTQIVSIRLLLRRIALLIRLLTGLAVLVLAQILLQNFVPIR